MSRRTAPGHPCANEGAITMELSQSAEQGITAEDISREEIRAVEGFVSKLVLAMKQANLYPKDHSISREAINELSRSVEAFTQKYGELVLEVGRNGFRYKDHDLPSVIGNRDIASRCHRDGIEWLIFASGIAQDELRTFVDIVNAHQIIGDEEEGDIVTSLWEADLQGIRYYTDNAIWRNEPLLDLSRFQVEKREKAEQGGSGEEQELDQAKNILDPSTDRHLWQLTAEEIEMTRQMVHEEEKRDHTGDIFDVLLVILEQQRTREEVTTALGIIRECFAKTLAKGLFRQTALFLEQIHRIRELYASESHWALPYLDEFLQSISGSRVLASLQEYFQKAGAGEEEQYRHFRFMVTQLPTESVEALVPLIPNAGVWGEELRKAVRELAQRDVRPLARLARNAQPEFSREALAVLGGMSHEQASGILREMIASRNPTVRWAAVQGLIEQGTEEWQELVSFLADSEAGVRRTVFRFLSRRRNPEVESAVREYIRQGKFSRRDSAFLYSLYRVLGNCGSQHAEEFLREKLFSTPALVGGVRAVHRKGAAAALKLMNSVSARETLSRASRSLWPTVRRAAHQAMELTDAS